MAEETKHEQFLKRLQLWIAVLVGVVTLVIGVYNAKNLFFTKQGPGGLSVTIQAGQGRPVPGAHLELYSGNALVATAVTDAKGEYERKALDPGNYSLKVSSPGFETDVVTIAVQPQKIGQFNVILRPTGSPLKAALEEAGAEWIKGLGTGKGKSAEAEKP